LGKKRRSCVTGRTEDVVVRVTFLLTDAVRGNTGAAWPVLQRRSIFGVSCSRMHACRQGIGGSFLGSVATHACHHGIVGERLCCLTYNACVPKALVGKMAHSAPGSSLFMCCHGSWLDVGCQQCRLVPALLLMQSKSCLSRKICAGHHMSKESLGKVE